MPLDWVSLHQVGFIFGKTLMTTDGNMYLSGKRFRVNVKGSDETLSVDSLALYNNDFKTAWLDLRLSRCATGNKSDLDTTSAGACFISIAFFDADSNFVFGHSFVSDDGFSLDGARKDLQATGLETEATGHHCFVLRGSALLAIHQAFLYSPTHAIEWVKPVRYFTLTASHLGAG